MRTKSRQSIFSSRLGAAKIRAEGAREEARQAIRKADRAEAEAWSIRMEGYGGPAQPSPTIAQCLNGGYGWLQVQCRRCETEASIPLQHVRRPRDTPIWKLEAASMVGTDFIAPFRLRLRRRAGSLLRRFTEDFRGNAGGLDRGG
jgi:hypothetical protein